VLADARPATARAFVAWTLRHGRALWALALLLAVPAAVRTADLYRRLRSELEELLPQEAPSVLAIDELRRRMAGLQHLGIVVDVGPGGDLAAGDRLLDDLAARIRTYPPELARGVRLGDESERAFVREHAPLYMDLGDLRSIRTRIEARRDYEVSKAEGALLDDDAPPPSLDFSDVEQKYDARGGTASRRGHPRFSSPEQHVTLALVDVGTFSTGRGRGAELLRRVRADLAALGGAEHYGSGIRVGFAGDVAISVEETSALMSDLSLSSALVAIAVVVAIVAYYRWWRSILILLPPLLLSTVYSFALASLPPFRVTELNSNTAFLGSIIVGNGINFGIVLLARYVEERRRGVSVEGALASATWSARPGTLSAALAAAVAYGSLALTEFRGFRQFGCIGGIGMVVCWAVTYVLVPPLTAWLDRGPHGAPPLVRARPLVMTPLAQLVAQRSALLLALGLVVSGAAVAELRHLGNRQLESDFSRLRSARTWETGEGYWGRKMDAVLGTYLTPTVVLTDDASAARAVAAALREQSQHEPLSEMVASVRDVDDVLPLDQPGKIAEVEAIRQAMTPRIRALVPPARKRLVDELLDGGALRPLSFADLPDGLTVGLRERDGTYGRAVLVFPRPGRALWQGEELERFVRTLRTTALSAVRAPGRSQTSTRLSEGASAPRVAGSLPLSADILSSIRRDGPLASACAFVGVLGVVVLVVRRRLATALVVGALGLGVLWLVGALLALGVRINFANFIAFPITFGIGVDYAVNIMSRYAQDGDRGIEPMLRTTGGAVALCSLTTIIGYSSLLVADNRALFSFGEIAVLGEVCCLAVAIVILPSLLWAGHEWWVGRVARN
jgi:predicted RND superfamily exporter protein